MGTTCSASKVRALIPSVRASPADRVGVDSVWVVGHVPPLAGRPVARSDVLYPAAHLRAQRIGDAFVPG